MSSKSTYGSALDPILFLIIFSDINENVKHTLSSFTDDNRFMKNITDAAAIVDFEKIMIQSMSELPKTSCKQL